MLNPENPLSQGREKQRKLNSGNSRTAEMAKRMTRPAAYGPKEVIS